ARARATEVNRQGEMAPIQIVESEGFTPSGTPTITVRIHSRNMVTAAVSVVNPPHHTAVTAAVGPSGNYPGEAVPPHVYQPALATQPASTPLIEQPSQPQQPEQPSQPVLPRFKPDTTKGWAMRWIEAQEQLNQHPAVWKQITPGVEEYKATARNKKN